MVFSDDMEPNIPESVGAFEPCSRSKPFYGAGRDDQFVIHRANSRLQPRHECLGELPESSDPTLPVNVTTPCSEIVVVQRPESWPVARAGRPDQLAS